MWEVFMEGMGGRYFFPTLYFKMYMVAFNNGLLIFNMKRFTKFSILTETMNANKISALDK